MFKLEMDTAAIKRAVLSNYFFAKDAIYNEDVFESYFYLDETGEPIFVIEERT